MKVNLGDFLKADMVKNGDIIEFYDEGEETESKSFSNEDGTPKIQFNIKIKMPDGSIKTATMNLTSRRLIAAEYSDESKEWIGKKAVLNLVMTNQGKKSIIFEPA